MLSRLNQVAVIAACDAISAAIQNIELRIKIKLDDLQPSVRAYFEARLAEDKQAIEGLNRLRADLHARGFQAYVEEHP